MLPPVSTLLSRLGVATLSLAVLLGSAGTALAVSTRDLVELSRAGLSDEVLVALVEADDTAYPLDATQIIELRRSGISERVILAMIRNGRRAAVVHEPPPVEAFQPAFAEPPVTAPPVEAAPVIVQPETQVIVVPYVPVFGRHPRPGPRPHTAPAAEPYHGFGRFMNDGWVDGRPPSGAR